MMRASSNKKILVGTTHPLLATPFPTHFQYPLDTSNILAQQVKTTYYDCMKLTINVDDALLDRVVEITEASSKTEAIAIALREVDRRARLVSVLREGLGASPDELKDMFDASSDPMALRAAEPGISYRVPEKD